MNPCKFKNKIARSPRKRPREKLAKVVQGPLCIKATPHSPSFLLRATACPSFYISSNTSSFQIHSGLRDSAASETQRPQRHSSFRDTAASETQQPQRHSSSKSSTLISNFERSRTPGNKGRGLSISYLLTIAVLKFQLWNLFCATAWNSPYATKML